MEQKNMLNMKNVIVTKIVKEMTSIALYGEDEPYRIKIIKSGWTDKFHVISEWGDTGEYVHKLLSHNEIIDMYKITLDELPTNQVFGITKKEILDNPNDADLGEFLRKKLYE